MPSRLQGIDFVNGFVLHILPWYYVFVALFLVWHASVVAHVFFVLLDSPEPRRPSL